MESAAVQSLLAGAIVLLAALYVGRRMYRTYAAARRKKGAGCGGDCGCGPHS